MRNEVQKAIDYFEGIVYGNKRSPFGREYESAVTALAALRMKYETDMALSGPQAFTKTMALFYAEEYIDRLIGKGLCINCKRELEGGE